MLAIGITGGIGSGKTTVCNIFAKLGSRILFSDELAKDIMNTDIPSKRKIQKEFGASTYTPEGYLDRKQLAKLIFHDAALKEKLEAIVHPKTIEYVGKEIADARNSGKHPLICVESALIFEANLADMFDYVVVVDAPAAERINRTVARDRVTRSEVLERMRMQVPAEEKRLSADFVLNNSSDLASLERNCTFLHGLLVSISKTPSYRDA